MNNACLIAAGAAASRRASKPSLKCHKKEDFVLKVQKRYYFEPRRYLTTQEPVLFTNVTAVPLSTIEYTKVPAKTFMAIRDFSIPASIALCSDFNTYVEDNFELFTSTDVWQFYDKQIINEYVNWVYDYCNIEIDSAVNYSVKYYWNVDIVRED